MSTPLFSHRLRGCAPRPLGAYLKALAVLRIVAEQADPQVRGCWRADGFELITTLDEAALVHFFLYDWSPSPAVSPWNKGSGLLGEDKKGVGPVVASTAPRFAALREGIGAAQDLTTEMAAAVEAEKLIKGEKSALKDKADKDRLAADPVYKQRLAKAARDCKRLKDELQPECQRRWRGPAARWLRAAVVLDADGKASFPALLGTGGNDGKLDFTNNALQRLGDLFELGSDLGDPRPGAEAALRAALFGDAGTVMCGGGIGQFAPADSGGANGTAGALADSALNPWDLPLLLEGALLFSAGTSRRLGSEGAERTVAPFSARGVAAGYGSASAADEGARGEQWMPIWSRPWTAGEISALLAEGRCQIGARRTDSALDVARAIARLGVARGVDAFERYAYIERNGKSNYAVPLGRWRVRAAPMVNLVDDLEAHGWWERIRRAARDEHAPGSLKALERRLEEAVLVALADESQPMRWQSVLISLAELEQQLVLSGAFTAKKRLRPLPRLSPGWVRAADDGGAELRLAVALAAALGDPKAPGRGAESLRGHWLPLDRSGGFQTREGGLALSSWNVVSGRDATADLYAIVQRRLVGASGGAFGLPILARPGAEAQLGDLVALTRGEVDLDTVMCLARALSALSWADFRPQTHAPAPPRRVAQIDPVFAVFRICHLSGPLQLAPGQALDIPVDPAISRLLASGDASRAYEIARRRLRAADVHSPLRAILLDAQHAGRLAASFAFPISATDTRRLVIELHPDKSNKEQPHVR